MLLEKGGYGSSQTGLAVNQMPSGFGGANPSPPTIKIQNSKSKVKIITQTMNLLKLQKDIYRNKVNRGFNVTDIGKEIVLMVEELGELARAYKNSNKKPAREINQREEITDAIGDLMVYCLGLCEMLGVNSEEILEKIVENNKKRSHTGHM